MFLQFGGSVPGAQCAHFYRSSTFLIFIWVFLVGEKESQGSY